MRRRFLSICLIFALIISLGIAFPVQAGPIELPMIPGNPTPSVPAGLQYKIANSKVTVTGYTGTATKLTIPSKIQNYPVSVIGEGAFQNCIKLTEVTIPGSVTVIESSAFEGCTGLLAISIPKSVVRIDSFAFKNCLNLTGVQVSQENIIYSSDSSGVLFDKGKTALIYAPCALPDGYEIPATVTKIHEAAFTSCKKLTKITIPERVSQIGNSAFESCTALTEIVFTGDAPAIGDTCFSTLTATAYYPMVNSSWTEEVRRDYGGAINWVSSGNLIPGDMDGDNVVDNRDVEYLLWCTLFPDDYTVTGNADFNNDNAIDNQDVEYLLWHTLFPGEYPLTTF